MFLIEIPQMTSGLVSRQAAGRLITIYSTTIRRVEQRLGLGPTGWFTQCVIVFKMTPRLAAIITNH